MKNVLEKHQCQGLALCVTLGSTLRFALRVFTCNTPSFPLYTFVFHHIANFWKCEHGLVIFIFRSQNKFV